MSIRKLSFTVIVVALSAAAAISLFLLLNTPLASPNFSSFLSLSKLSSLEAVRTLSGENAIILSEPVALVRNIVIITILIILLILNVVYIWIKFENSDAVLNSKNSQRLNENRQYLISELSAILESIGHQSESVISRNGALKRAGETVSNEFKIKEVRMLIEELVVENASFSKELAIREDRLRKSQEKIASLKIHLAKTKASSNRDPLTNIFNRRYFDEELSKRALGAVRRADKLSLIISDIDNFKTINDRFGHQVGDEVIRVFAQIISSRVANEGTAARYGGEEFAVILPQLSLAKAQILAEQIRKQFAEKNLVVRGADHLGNVTASFGVAELRSNESSADLIRRADERLYAAKAAGKNFVAF